MNLALAVLGLILLAVWIKVCERLIIRNIDDSLMIPFERDLRAKRAKQEKCND
jgi:hypothetical protein